jgi:hypothetical protein
MLIPRLKMPALDGASHAYVDGQIPSFVELLFVVLFDVLSSTIPILLITPVNAAIGLPKRVSSLSNSAIELGRHIHHSAGSCLRQSAGARRMPTKACRGNLRWTAAIGGSA